MKKALFILLSLILLLLLPACGEPEAEQDPDVIDHQQFLSETVYIGCVLPITGADGQRAELLQAAQQTAAEVINGAYDDVDWDMAKNPGIAGYGGAWVELVYADCGVEEPQTSTSQVAEQPAQQTTQPAQSAGQTAQIASQPAQQTPQSSAVTPAELQQQAEEAAAAAAQELIDQGVVALIGAYRS
ncbi:MAG: hypothetical protein IJH59_06330, partial [Firmicutes bacterium]|nr:hypothetical protein [Bacillota bacterium]